MPTPSRENRDQEQRFSPHSPRRGAGSSLKPQPRAGPQRAERAAGGLPRTGARAGSSRPRPTSRVLKASLSHFPRRLLQQLSSE